MVDLSTSLLSIISTILVLAFVRDRTIIAILLILIICLYLFPAIEGFSSLNNHHGKLDYAYSGQHIRAPACRTCM